jgi:hypothetical protein
MHVFTALTYEEVEEAVESKTILLLQETYQFERESKRVSAQ